MKKNILKYKNLLITILVIILLISFSYILYYYLVLNKDYSFKLKGDNKIQLLVNSEYIEKGAIAKINNEDVTDEIVIDSSRLNTKSLGKYKIIYTLIAFGKEQSIYREVEVIDNVKPLITLKGAAEITILINDKYEELGYEVKDNYDHDINNKVKIDNKIDNTKEGKYKVTYSVMDTSGNEASIERIVFVKKPEPVVIAKEEEKIVITKPTYSSSNGITFNKWTTNGIYLEGYISDSNSTYRIIAVDESNNRFEYPMTYVSETKYKGEININSLTNGNYKMYIVSTNEEQLLNELATLAKIVRTKIGDKLVTFSYNNKYMSFKVEDFSYAYDILIDPGHGSGDTGAINKLGVRESDMNLKISLYEKCRYEAHGLSVLMTRTSDNLFSLMGDSSMKPLHKRAYTMGYYGVVSKINYSNHHNAINNANISGFEILTPAALTYEQLQSEHNIYNNFLNIYTLTENHKRFYTRNNDNDVIYTMLNGETYTFDDYYAIIRIPYMLYKTKMVIFEGIYITNNNDYNWYWINNNWVNVSEIKIEEYVTKLGKSYNSDNSSCNSYL